MRATAVGLGDAPAAFEAAPVTARRGRPAPEAAAASTCAARGPGPVSTRSP
jgi:hypothetical protein